MQQLHAESATTPQLHYGFVLSQGSQNSLTYLNAGQAGTITLLISNAGSPIAVTSIAVGLVVGSAATDIIAAPGDAHVVMPEGWTDLGNFTYAPPEANPFIGTGGVTFTFNVNVNDEPGTTVIGIREVTAAGTAFMTPPFSLNKMPAVFVLADATASPIPVEPDGLVTLSWTATPAQLYEVTWPGGSAPVVPAASLATWSSGPVQTSGADITFIIAATVQAPSGVITVQAAVTVPVDVPQIISFPQPPHPFLQTAVALTWSTVNADHCQLYSNGLLVDGSAPANTGPGGYTVSPTTSHTQYQLYAVKGSTTVSSQPITVVLYSWQLVTTLTFDYSNLNCAISPDGAFLYVAGAPGIWQVDTRSNTIVQTGGKLTNDSSQCCVSTDNAYLFIRTFDGIVAVPTSNLSAAHAAIAPECPFMATSGASLFTLSAGSFNEYDTRSGTLLHQVALGSGTQAGGIMATADGTAVYFVHGPDDSSSQGLLYRYDRSTSAVTQLCTNIGGMYQPSLALSHDGETVFVAAADLKHTQAIAVPAGTFGTTYMVDSTGGMTGMLIADPAGAGFYATYSYHNGGPRNEALFFVEAGTGATALISNPQGGIQSDLAVSPDGSRVYYLYANQLMIFSSIGSFPSAERPAPAQVSA